MLLQRNWMISVHVMQKPEGKLHQENVVQAYAGATTDNHHGCQKQCYAVVACAVVACDCLHRTTVSHNEQPHGVARQNKVAKFDVNMLVCRSLVNLAAFSRL